ncbi:MAG TPA: SRPBCC family protein [Pseudonocardia sp.]|nr:SRPBCC family protein [Pseudonocardia sp.]
MDTSRKLQASRIIDAPADQIFEVLADPNRHTDLDGADMLRGMAAESPPIVGIGQSFTMNMHQPDLGDYRIVNRITAFVPGSRIGWEPHIDPTSDLADKLGDMDAAGHTYTYDLREVDGGTEVTQTYEWMSVKDPDFAAFFPRVSQDQLQASLDKLADAVR